MVSILGRSFMNRNGLSKNDDIRFLYRVYMFFTVPFVPACILTKKEKLQMM